MARAPRAFLLAALVAASFPVALVAQAGPGGLLGSGAAPRLTLGFAGGFASEAPLGVSRQVAGHGLVAVGYAPRRSPVEVRADVMYVTWADPAGQVSVNATGVLPVAHVGVAGAAVRPYLLAGAGAHEFGAGRPRAVSAHAGVGLRAERARYAAFGELRRHAAYGQSFLSLGATIRR
jgi:hypothetical protein